MDRVILRGFREAVAACPGESRHRAADATRPTLGGEAMHARNSTPQQNDLLQAALALLRVIR